MLLTSISSKNLKNTRKCMLPNSTKYAKRKGFGKFGCLMIKNDRNGLRVIVIGLLILGFGYGNISPVSYTHLTLPTILLV